MLFPGPSQLQLFARTHFRTSALCAPFVLVSLAQGMPGLAQQVNPIRIDSSEPFREPEAAPYEVGAAKSPTGSLIGLNSRYLTLNGTPRLPVMGEFHFSRYPRAQWEE